MRTQHEIDCEYSRWMKNIDAHDDLYEELLQMDPDSKSEAFCCDMTFGTGGLRGIIGAGTNRINRFTVSRASQGLANYITRQFIKDPSIAIAFDSRVNSDIFSEYAAKVFSANGIKVYLYHEIMPTPCLSYAVRSLRCSAGIVITASHNPSEYNGYKVYGSDGCQITTEVAKEIYSEIEKVDFFSGIKYMANDTAVNCGKVVYIDPSIYTSFVERVKNQSVLYGDSVDRNIRIVFSPLNGTGKKPVLKVLQETGFTDITLVAEQSEPNGLFPTCPYPNPEEHEAMELGLNYCKKLGAELLLATDPDADRCGVAVRVSDNQYKLLTGNEVGILLLDFICSQRTKHGKMPKKPVFIKTIVTTDLAEKIAAHYGVETINVLTGFKFIGEMIGFLEHEGRENDYIFGFEESCGFLSGTYVRDKDAINAVILICEMAAYYKKHGITLVDRLEELYLKYGYSMNSLYSYKLSGLYGAEKIQKTMNSFRLNRNSFGHQKITEVIDYSEGFQMLPKANVIKYSFENGSSLVIRPSGTEPKLKVYISILADNRDAAKGIESKLKVEVESIINDEE